MYFIITEFARWFANYPQMSAHLQDDSYFEF